MDPANFSPAHVTEGQKRRTLRGFDGRIRHVETLVERAYGGMTKAHEEAVNGLSTRIAANDEGVRAAVAALEARVAALEAAAAAPKPADESKPVETV